MRECAAQRAEGTARLAGVPSSSKSLTVRLVAPDCLHAQHDRITGRVQGRLERFAKNSASSAADLHRKKRAGRHCGGAYGQYFAERVLQPAGAVDPFPVDTCTGCINDTKQAIDDCF